HTRPARRALRLRRAHRPGVSDDRRYSRRRGILRSAGQDRRKRRATGKDHFPRRLWLGGIEAHGRSRAAEGARRARIFWRARGPAASIGRPHRSAEGLTKARLDVMLAERGLAESREK